jgi:ABC-type lipoprotein export system ATPase subunit
MFIVKNASKKYNSEYALHDVNLTIGKGMNFIIGSSGSGKTTLLKMISGMDSDFDGEVFYDDKSMKELSESEKSYFYNHVFGFIWQDFHLLDNHTVLENVMLPAYLNHHLSEKTAEKLLRDLKIQDFAGQKVKNLSGGQKQRVAIARELMKNPQVILADEPTSALDEKSAKMIMDILRSISKSRTVIVVTHDTSFVTDKDNIIELDKGELISATQSHSEKISTIKTDLPHCLSIKNALGLSLKNTKKKLGRFSISVISILIASILMLTTVNGMISSSSQKEFDELFDTYGESLTDISVLDHFTGAAGTDGKNNDAPNRDVNQNLEGIFEKYAEDDRVSVVTFSQPFDNITVTYNGKEYKVPMSGSMPHYNNIVAGNMPMGTDKEVAVPESFVKSIGLSPKEAIGKEIKFEGSPYTDWSGNEPVYHNASVTATIVGVVDTTTVSNMFGEVYEYSIEDSFFFSQPAMSELMKQVNKKIGNVSLTIRAKTPKDMIAIKDELNANGIVPLGQFELVEDMVRLQEQTTQQSGSANIIIGMLSFVMIAAIFLITGFLRKKEYAVYKISGYKTTHLVLLGLSDALFYGITAVFTFLVTSPVLNLATKGLFKMDILNVEMIFVGVGFILLFAAFAYLLSLIPCLKVDLSKELKAGER